MKRILLYSLVGLIALFIASALAFAIFQPIKVLPRIRLSPGFTLIDQDGQRLTNEDLRGKLVVYSFTYTNCQPPCVQPVNAQQQIEQGLADLALGDIPVTLVTISFDTQQDTPATLKNYAQSLGADLPHWRFVSATPQQAASLKVVIGEGFKVFYTQDAADGAFKFDPVLVLVDGWGIIRGEYRYGTPEANVQHVLDHLEVLVEEIHNSTGAAKLAYEAAHLFMCYAP